MAYIYFEALAEDGTLEPEIIPRDHVGVFRPISADELRYAEIRGKLDNESALLDGEKTELKQLRRILDLKHVICPPDGSKSVLASTDGRKFFLPLAMKELAKALPEIQVLNGNPSADRPGVERRGQLEELNS